MLGFWPASSCSEAPPPPLPASAGPSQTSSSTWQVPFLFVCFKSNEAVSSPARSSLAVLFVPVVLARAVFHFRSLQSCGWSLFDHTAAKAPGGKFWLKKSALQLWVSMSGGLTNLQPALCLRAPCWELYGVRLAAVAHLSHWRCRHSKPHRSAAVSSTKVSTCESPVLHTLLPVWPICFLLYQKSRN